MVCLLFAACQSGSRRYNLTSTGYLSPVVSEAARFYIDTLHTGLENPWGMVWLPDGRALITERRGDILIFKDGQYTGRHLTNLSPVYARGQGGLMDIQLHPDYPDNGWIYISYAKPGPAGGGTALARFRLSGEQVIDFEILYETTPQVSAGIHFGSRITFDKDGYVYFSTGERGQKDNAQDLSNDLGKIHRLYDDGRIPDDNPFAGRPDVRPSIWSYGHRNIQGMIYDPETHRIWATEHGPRGGDELNLIEKGKNYGWPAITYGIDYTGAIISELTELPGMEQPIHYWTPSLGTCGLHRYSGEQFSKWKGNLFTGALALTRVVRIVLDGDRYISEETLLDGVGRVRYITEDSDGHLYILTESPGLLLKLRHAED